MLVLASDSQGERGRWASCRAQVGFTVQTGGAVQDRHVGGWNQVLIDGGPRMNVYKQLSSTVRGVGLSVHRLGLRIEKEAWRPARQ